MFRIQAPKIVEIIRKSEFNASETLSKLSSEEIVVVSVIGSSAYHEEKTHKRAFRLILDSFGAPSLFKNDRSNRGADANNIRQSPEVDNNVELVISSNDDNTNIRGDGSQSGDSTFPIIEDEVAVPKNANINGSSNLGLVDGFYTQDERILFLHLHGAFDPKSLLAEWEQISSDLKSQDMGFSQIWAKIKTKFCRSLLLLFSLSHVVLVSNTGGFFDTSYIQLFRILDTVRHEVLPHASKLLGKIDGIPKPWKDHGRMCSPRILFLFQVDSGQPLRISEELPLEDPIKDQQYKLEDEIYHILRKCRIVTNISANSLFAIPSTQEYVFIYDQGVQEPEMRDDPISRLNHLTVSFCEKMSSSFMDPAMSDYKIAAKLTFASTFPTIYSTNASKKLCEQRRTYRDVLTDFREFITSHTRLAHDTGFDDDSKHVSEHKHFFVLPTLNTWMKAFDALSDYIVYDNHSDHRAKDALSLIHQFNNVDTEYLESQCAKVFPKVYALYLKNLPEIYSEKLHNAKVSHVVDAFLKVSRGPGVRPWVTKLIEKCDRYWKRGRQQCEARSLHEHTCCHALHRFRVEDHLEVIPLPVMDESLPEKEHSTGLRILSYCNCGHRQGSRDEPFTIREANYSFYERMSHDCCDHLERIDFPFFSHPVDNPEKKRIDPQEMLLIYQQKLLGLLHHGGKYEVASDGDELEDELRQGGMSLDQFENENEEEETNDNQNAQQNQSHNNVSIANQPENKHQIKSSAVEPTATEDSNKIHSSANANTNSSSANASHTEGVKNDLNTNSSTTNTTAANLNPIPTYASTTKLRQGQGQAQGQPAGQENANSTSNHQGVNVWRKNTSIPIIESDLLPRTELENEYIYKRIRERKALSESESESSVGKIRQKDTVTKPTTKEVLQKNDNVKSQIEKQKPVPSAYQSKIQELSNSFKNSIKKDDEVRREWLKWSGLESETNVKPSKLKIHPNPLSPTINVKGVKETFYSSFDLPMKTMALSMRFQPCWDQRSKRLPDHIVQWVNEYTKRRRFLFQDEDSSNPPPGQWHPTDIDSDLLGRLSSELTQGEENQLPLDENSEWRNNNKTYEGSIDRESKTGMGPAVSLVSQDEDHLTHLDLDEELGKIQSENSVAWLLENSFDDKTDREFPSSPQAVRENICDSPRRNPEPTQTKTEASAETGADVVEAGIEDEYPSLSVSVSASVQKSNSKPKPKLKTEPEHFISNSVKETQRIRETVQDSQKSQNQYLESELEQVLEVGLENLKLSEADQNKLLQNQDTSGSKPCKKEKEIITLGNKVTVDKIHIAVSGSGTVLDSELKQGKENVPAQSAPARESQTPVPATPAQEEREDDTSIQYLPGMLHSRSLPHLLPLFSSWSLLCLGSSSLYTHTSGITHQPGFLAGSSTLLPWDKMVKAEAGVSKPIPRLIRGRKPTGRARRITDEFNVKVFIGVEYECKRGHRFFLESPDRILQTNMNNSQHGPPNLKEAANIAALSDMPLYYRCPCKESRDGSVMIAQLMRIHVITPKAPVHVTLNPRVQPGPAPCPIFHPGNTESVKLTPSSYWMLRLPYCYVGDDQVYVPSRDVARYNGRLLKGLYDVESMSPDETQTWELQNSSIS